MLERLVRKVNIIIGLDQSSSKGYICVLDQLTGIKDLQAQYCQLARLLSGFRKRMLCYGLYRVWVDWLLCLSGFV